MMETNESSRRRRSRGFVIRNACIECRKRKARCDGKQPCSRCASAASLVCQYAVSVQVSKETMRSEIEGLQEYRKHSERILGSLATGSQSNIILEQLRNGETLESLAYNIENGTLLDGTGDGRYFGPDVDPESTSNGYFSMGSCSSVEMSGESLQNFRLQANKIMEDGDHDAKLYEGTTWTTVTGNMEVVEHLMSLYFCWEYPVFASFSKRHFLEDFQSGLPSYCSPLLVNAILALGCRYSDRPLREDDLGNKSLTDDLFFAEAERLLGLERDNPPSLTTIQGIGLMAIRELSCGRDIISQFYSGQSIRMAVEMRLHVQSDNMQLSDDELDIRSITFWGAFSLHEVWSLCTGHIPYISRKGIHLEKPSLIEIDEKSEWCPYIDTGFPPGRLLHQSSNIRSVFQCFSDFSEIVHNSLYILYDPTRALTGQDVLGIYGTYLQWYESLPRPLRLGENSTPPVLFAHMYYHFAILLLFGPFIKVSFLESRISPTQICLQAADAITSLVSSYRQLFTLRRTPSFVPYIVLASGIMHLACADFADKGIPNLSVNASMHILQGTADLLEMIQSHTFARRGTQVLRIMAQELNDAEATRDLSWPRYLDGMLSTSLDISNDTSSGNTILLNNGDPSDALTRRSHTAILFFSDEMDSGMGRQSGGSMNNSIFCPFPTQVVPLVGLEKLLQRDGFLLI